MVAVYPDPVRTIETVTKLRAEAERLENEAMAAMRARRFDEAKDALEAAVRARVYAEDIERELNSTQTMGTLEPMQAAPELSHGAKVSLGRVDQKTNPLFRLVLLEKGMTVSDWVRKHKKTHPDLSENTAKGWLKRKGAGGRAVPRVWSDFVAREFKEPGLRNPDNWPNGIRD